MMYQPTHLDGNTLVVISRHKGRFMHERSGRLSYDGDVLTVDNVPLSEAEIASIKPVVAGTLIEQAVGFDFFLMLNE